MIESGAKGIRVGAWLVEPNRDLIRNSETKTSLRPQVMDLLVFLAHHPGEVISPDQLMDELWEGKVVTSASVYTCLNELRHALGDDSHNPSYLETISKRGYRLIAPVEFLDPTEQSDEQEAAQVLTGAGQARTTRLLIILLGLVVMAVIAITGVNKTMQHNESELVGPQKSEATIAVLPFVDMSANKDQEYMSDGIAEELTNLLAKLPELRVISRSSAFSYKDKDVNLAEIAKELNVAHILEGSVRKSGKLVRITVQLIEARTDTHLWSETYDRTLNDIFAIQDEIAAAVVDSLRIKLLDKQPRATKTDPEAYALYLEGRYLNNQSTAESLKQAEALLKQSLEIDPGFAPALATLGTVYRNQAFLFGLLPRDEAYELARDAIQRALAIDPEYGPAYFSLHWVERDAAASTQALRQAQALNPDDADFLRALGMRELALGNIDDALSLMDRSILSDPLTPQGHTFLGYLLYVNHRLEEAERALRMALALAPNAIWAQWGHGLVLLERGDAPAALAAMKQEADEAFRLQGIAIVQHALGDTEASDAALQDLLECCEIRQKNIWIAEAYAYRGEADNAFYWLDIAYDNGDGFLAIALFDPLFAKLYDDPRWEPMLDKIRSQLSDIP